MYVIYMCWLNDVLALGMRTCSDSSELWQHGICWRVVSISSYIYSFYIVLTYFKQQS